MNIGNEIKKLAIDNCITLTNLAENISEAKGKPYSVQNLSSKLKKGTINANEIGRAFLAWETPWTEEPGGKQSMRLQRAGHD